MAQAEDACMRHTPPTHTHMHARGHECVTHTGRRTDRTRSMPQDTDTTPSNICDGSVNTCTIGEWVKSSIHTFDNTYRPTYFTLLESNSSAIGVEWIHNRASPLHPVVDIGHRDSHLIVPSRYIIFPAVSWPSLGRRPSGWITSALLPRSRWCHPFDV